VHVAGPTAAGVLALKSSSMCTLDETRQSAPLPWRCTHAWQSSAMRVSSASMRSSAWGDNSGSEGSENRLIHARHKLHRSVFFHIQIYFSSHLLISIILSFSIYRQPISNLISWTLTGWTGCTGCTGENVPGSFQTTPNVPEQLPDHQISQQLPDHPVTPSYHHASGFNWKLSHKLKYQVTVLVEMFTIKANSSVKSTSIRMQLHGNVFCIFVTQ